ncbi:CPBP family intramembrane metalloprotease [Paenibacillus motobuensis]|uniref:CPBP family intramembrane glutamic endopeptidase n=1 Tax=Paenibacillus TaxID=44249 RepID=UPI0020406A38|nr:MULTISPECIES: type II CAAX endopeptidase family protein [Paenibacillus]MCM3039696.1 CPBP family intramembrane metalloprotease [Paenibacillus lutimineralis]MCM3646800.1 CPBP family intramembrane metalloprotease [Paenibacillus motobuensis]
MRKEMSRFLIYTFVTSWVIWGGLALMTQFKWLKFGTPISMILFILGGVTPAICEIWLKKKYSSKEEFRSFIQNIKNSRHPFLWYIFTIGLAFAACFLPTLWGGASMENPLYLALIEFPIMIIGGGLEEIGWRGYLQPTLQKKWSPFNSTLIVGGIWSIWHLPLWFVVGSNQMNMNFLWFTLSALALSFLLTVIYSATNSIFLCIVFHALINSFWDVYIPNTNVTSALLTLLFALFIFTAFEFYRNKNQSKI